MTSRLSIIYALSASLVCICVAGACSGRLEEDRDPIDTTSAELRNSGSLHKSPSSQTADDITLSSARDLDGGDSPGTQVGLGACLIGDWPRHPARMNLEAQKAPIREILERIARFTHLNIIPADNVKGQVTSSMKMVPWTQALEATLRSKNLVAVKEGNVIRILRRVDWLSEAGLHSD